MAAIPCEIAYGGSTIRYRLTFADRKSVEIAVYPDGAVMVKAPAGTGPEVVADRVRKRARWIRRQILYFEQFSPRTPQRRYVGGESHLYLGRRYRLKITSASGDSVRLQGGFFFIESRETDSRHVARLMGKWYREKAAVHFDAVFQEAWQQFCRNGAAKPRLRIRRMKSRWGSLSETGILTLNLELVRAPRECIEYVVMHELCHLYHAHHGPAFYALLERSLPDWLKRKHKLETLLA